MKQKLLTAMITFAAAFASNALSMAALAQHFPTVAELPALTADAVNGARLDAGMFDRVLTDGTADRPDPAIVRLQILLDRAAASPGVIDGFDGDNLRKALAAFAAMQGMEPARDLAHMLGLLETGGPVIGHYTITAEDAAALRPPLPEDYAEQAKRDFLGHAGIDELVAERFHMDVDLLRALNPASRFAVGEPVLVAAFGPDRAGTAARLEADKTNRQLRVYDATDRLIAAYPATIGSAETPSPTGTHEVNGVARMPTYSYDPERNFQQAGNTEPLELPPGPNGPVGTVWIDLSEPTYGIHGTPEPSLIGKTGSHGCVRLTNWDAEELAAMVAPGVAVTFLG